MSFERVINEGIKNKFLDTANTVLDLDKVKGAFEEALKKIDKGMVDFGNQFTTGASTEYVYGVADIYMGGWQQGFWTGILWHAYVITGNEKYKELAMNHTPQYLDKIEKKAGVNHHDMGFVFSPSCVYGYKLTGDEKARKAALLAAEQLTTRYNEKGRFIQAWGNMGEDNRLIVDCFMNIPLLYWATEESGDPKYREMAYNHFRTALNNTVRDNAGSHQTFLFDKDTGAPIRGMKDQGLTDDTTWSRGQGWCIYGMMLTRKYVDDPDAVEICKKMANFYINRLPEDFVPYWDFEFTEGDEPRDTSAATVAMCGLMDLVKRLPETDPDRELYQKVINATMNSLIDNYTTKDIERSNGLLTGATYSKPHNLGIDECNIWGDYYYMEALVRFLKPDWECCW